MSKFNKKELLLLVGCFAAYMLAYVGRLNFAAAISSITASLPITDVQLGLAQSVFSICYAAGQLGWGVVLDRMQARRFLIIGLLGTACCNLLVGLSAAYWQILLFWSLNGVFQSMLWSPIVKTVSMAFSGPKRTKASYTLSFTLVMGNLTAWALSGYIAHLWSWRLSFIVPCALYLLFLPLIYHLLGDTPAAASVETQKEAYRPTVSIGQLLRTRELAFMLLACVACGYIREGIMMWGPSIIEQVLPEQATASTTFSLLIPVINMLGIWGGRMLLRSAADKTRRTCALLFIISCAISLGFAVLRDASILLLVCYLGITCALMYGMHPILTALIPMEYSSVGRVAFVAGIIDCFIYLGTALSSLSLGYLRSVLGIHAVALIWAVIALLGSALAYCSVKKAKGYKAAQL